MIRLHLNGTELDLLLASAILILSLSLILLL